MCISELLQYHSGYCMENRYKGGESGYGEGKHLKLKGAIKTERKQVDR